MFRATCAAIALASLAPVSLASDGLFEINQACATSTSGCFPGDSGGFPVTITQPGSYRLAGNLSVPPNTTAIQINAAMVTLDLGGFLVSGPNTCTGYPTTACATQGGNPGITSDQFLVVVRNGIIAGMGGTGIHLLGASSEVDSVRVLACGLDGIDIGGAGRVTHSFSGNNWSFGIKLLDGATADDNESRANGGNGIYAEQGGRLTSSVTRNRAYDNASIGIVGDGTTLMSKNVASGNAAPNQIVFGKSLGDNVCTGTLC